MYNISQLTCRNCRFSRLIHDFSKLYQPIYMVLFTWSLVTICSTLLLMHVQIVKQYNGILCGLLLKLKLFQMNSELDVAMLLVTVFCTFYAYSLTFIACENGEQMTSAFDEILCVIGDFSWYRFPIEIQQMLPLLMIDAQKEVALECFGSVSCSRNDFKKVCSTNIHT